MFGLHQFCPKSWGKQIEAKKFGFFKKKHIHTAKWLPNSLTCSARQIIFQQPSKENLSKAALSCSSEKLFIKSHNKFIRKHSCRGIISKKAAWQTELETASELFCVEDSKSNHE